MMALGFGLNANPPEILKSREHRLPIGKRANVNNYYRSLRILRFSGPRIFIAKDLKCLILESINDKSSDPQNFFARRPFPGMPSDIAILRASSLKLNYFAAHRFLVTVKRDETKRNYRGFAARLSSTLYGASREPSKIHAHLDSQSHVVFT